MNLQAEELTLSHQPSREERVSALTAAFKNRVMVLDGAMGTAIQDLNLTAEEFGGKEHEGCNENLNLTRPHLIEEIFETYLEAGADIITTNTFGATPLVLSEFNLSPVTKELNKQAAAIARKVADRYSTDDTLKFVAGSIGPTTKAISVTEGITFDELIENFKVQAEGLYEGGVDYFLIETCQDTRNTKAALIAINELQKKLPIAVSGTIEPMGTMLAGQTVEALATSLEHVDLLYLGLNCATGPEFMTDHIRTLAQMSLFRIGCVPNAGLPDEFGNYLETPEIIAKVLKNFGEKNWLNLIGGCCGTTPKHIEALVNVSKNLKPHVPVQDTTSRLSGIDVLEVTDEKRPLLVGERTNVIGSRKFKRLINEDKINEACEVAKKQIKNGAHIIDICLANPDRNELKDMEIFLSEVIKKIKVPLMIDSTHKDVISHALTYSQGKAIINSINLEDGEKRFAEVIPLAKKYGAALVVGTIDEDPEQGMGVIRQRKLEIAKRSYDLLVHKYGLSPKDIYWDPLVFPCATGDEQYVGSAEETIEALKLLKKEFSETKTILGISNVSFGLPPAGREVLNSVFLYHCTQAGLDLAIVNTEKIERYASLSDKEKELSDNLIFNKGSDPIAEFANYFRGKKSRKKMNTTNLSVEERLANYIVEGSQEGLVEDLQVMLKKNIKPLKIINGPLMKGMDEVGRLFNKNELIVAEVLQSAESMKAAVNYLEPLMEKKDTSHRGKMILATVKGDVHDIGKNLVEIIFSNNGFEIINLGIKVPPEELIRAAHEHKPDLIGLSGLLVKSAQQMVVTCHDLKTAGVKIPILVGGAALSRNFVDRQISKAYSGFVDYAQDAMSGLELAKTFVDKKTFEKHQEDVKSRRENLEAQSEKQKNQKAYPAIRSKEVEIIQDIPVAPDGDRHILKDAPLDMIWKYVNPLMLYTKHLGVKAALVKLWSKDLTEDLKKSEEGQKSLKIFEAVSSVREEYKEKLKPKAVYQFFGANSQKNRLHIFQLGSEKLLKTFDFPRQQREDGLCLSDYSLPVRLGIQDNIALFVTSVGEGIRELAEDLKKNGHYLKCHALQALALELAEGYAEMLHAHIRKVWGYPDPVDMTMMSRFQAKYRGKRYSFGYPACPCLEDQVHLFDLLKPENIGVKLSEEFMMEPEASVSAIVFHHPSAKYYSV